MTTRIFLVTTGKYMDVKLTVIGCSPAWNNPGGANSGYLVEADGSLLLDCGPGVLPRLRQRTGWPAVDAIAISHLHLDHWGDLVPWVWGLMYGPGRTTARPALFLPPGSREALRPVLARVGFETMLDEAFELREYVEGEAFETAGFAVTPVRVDHYGLDCFGFRVANGSGTLAYSADSGPCDRLVELARDADVFLCEATLERGELEGSPRGHLDIPEAVDAFRRSGARRLLLTHRPAELAVDDGLELVREGQTFAVEAR
jgi:ribonuclease BN (tRNA processing enzyme)